ncbi:N-acetyltransferase [Micromonospora chokoriensis]|nr:N-acetyltransferase [Micromonospora chokoriensis]
MNLAVQPLCPFYARFIGRHPEYQDLVRAGAHHRIVLGGHDG